MEQPYDYAEAFRAAARAVGGEKELAQRLGVSVEELHAWMEARGTPPLESFVEALDVIELST
jgi:DNA-binding transcriptional regulator YdaS (Cro superfamily)